jgi:signal transduction histidine kinase
VIAEVERISELVRGLYHIAQRDPIEPHPVDLAVAVRHAVADVAVAAARAGLEVEQRAGAPRQAQQCGPVSGDQRLVGGRQAAPGLRRRPRYA